MVSECAVCNTNRHKHFIRNCCHLCKRRLFKPKYSICNLQSHDWGMRTPDCHPRRPSRWDANQQQRSWPTMVQFHERRTPNSRDVGYVRPTLTPLFIRFKRCIWHRRNWLSVFGLRAFGEQLRLWRLAGGLRTARHILGNTFCLPRAKLRGTCSSLIRTFNLVGRNHSLTAGKSSTRLSGIGSKYFDRSRPACDCILCSGSRGLLLADLV